MKTQTPLPSKFFQLELLTRKRVTKIYEFSSVDRFVEFYCENAGKLDCDAVLYLKYVSGNRVELAKLKL